jgi:hypothetical protein
MIRIGTCIIAALVFLGMVFMANFIESLVIHQEQYAFIPALTIGYLLGLLRMRAMANQGRQAEDDDLRRTIAVRAIAARPISKAQWMRRRGKWSE